MDQYGWKLGLVKVSCTRRYKYRSHKYLSSNRAVESLNFSIGVKTESLTRLQMVCSMTHYTHCTKAFLTF